MLRVLDARRTLFRVHFVTRRNKSLGITRTRLVLVAEPARAVSVDLRAGFSLRRNSESRRPASVLLQRGSTIGSAGPRHQDPTAFLFSSWRPPDRRGVFSRRPLDCFRVRDADWSNDATRLVVARAVGPGDSDPNELLIVDFATRRTQKIPGSDNLLETRWSPDGHYISASEEDGSQLKLWSFAARRWSVIARGRAFGLGVWSHDSRYLYFQDLQVQRAAALSLRR